MTSPVILRKDEIIERLATGEKLLTIAQSMGYKSHAVISKYLADDPEYQAAIELSLDERMHQRERELEQADDSVTVTRARELLSHARWRAERECRRRWGRDTANDGPNTAIQVVINR